MPLNGRPPQNPSHVETLLRWTTANVRTRRPNLEDAHLHVKTAVLEYAEDIRVPGPGEQLFSLAQRLAAKVAKA